jgi:hypothetical protein
VMKCSSDCAIPLKGWKNEMKRADELKIKILSYQQRLLRKENRREYESRWRCEKHLIR